MLASPAMIISVTTDVDSVDKSDPKSRCPAMSINVTARHGSRDRINSGVHDVVRAIQPPATWILWRGTFTSMVRRCGVHQRRRLRHLLGNRKTPECAFHHKLLLRHGTASLRVPM